MNTSSKPKKYRKNEVEEIDSEEQEIRRRALKLEEDIQRLKVIYYLPYN